VTHGSLFAGIGGFDLGFERAGIETVWQVEIDPFCRKVLEKHWPNVQRFSDISTVCRKGEQWRSCWLETVDIISGGFPCQDISQAGKKVGIEGERSGLWREMFRIICELRPKYAVIENVSALLERGIERVLCDLAAAGFDAEWQVVSACEFGAPHTRERVFIVAYPNQGRYRIVGQHSENDRMVGNQMLTESTTAPVRSRVWDEAPSRFVGMAHRSANWSHRIESLGNAVVPQIAEWIGKRLVKLAGAGESVS